MADPAEFAPAELDHLEDALEGLELVSSFDGAPHVRRRLDEYRNILTLSRAAMPMVEVPRGLLDDVLAQARASVEVPSITPAVAVPPPQPSFWSRVRRWGLLPGVALAGTAAIVMVMVERKPAGESVAVVASESAPARSQAMEPTSGVAETAKREARAEAKSEADVEGQAAAAAQAEAPNDVVTTKSVAPAAPPPAEPMSPTPSAAPGRSGGEALDQRSKADDAAAEYAPKEEEKSADKALPVVADIPRWDTIVRADRKRHEGNCSVARNEYALALDDMDARVRARAHAGLGLCDAAAGNQSAADAAYEIARDLDAEIATFIQNERARGAGTSKANAKPKAAKKSKAEPPRTDDAFE